MDLELYVRVLWRYRVLVGIGLGVALLLALLTTVRVGAEGISYRQTELWASTSRLGVTQQGFPWGRLFAQGAVTSTLEERAERSGIPIADPNRFKDLAFLYAELATTDPVRQLMLEGGPIAGEVRAAPVIAQNQITLPLIDVTGIAASREAAIALARRAGNALQRYVQEEQRANDVPTTDRVVLEPLREPQSATIFQARSQTMAFVVFLAVAFATVVLVFLLENKQLRVPALSAGDERPRELQRDAFELDREAADLQKQADGLVAELKADGVNPLTDKAAAAKADTSYGTSEQVGEAQEPGLQRERRRTA